MLFRSLELPGAKERFEAASNLLGRDLLAICNGEAEGELSDLGDTRNTQPALFVVESLLVDIEATAQPLIAKNNNNFKLDLASFLGEVLLDQTKVRQIVLNLLSNAAKFTSDGEIGLKAERMEERGLDWLAISVSDSGIGMTSDQLDKVFDPFSQSCLVLSLVVLPWCSHMPYPYFLPTFLHVEYRHFEKESDFSCA